MKFCNGEFEAKRDSYGWTLSHLCASAKNIYFEVKNDYRRSSYKILPEAQAAAVKAKNCPSG